MAGLWSSDRERRIQLSPITAASMLHGSLVTRLLSIDTLSISPECLATVNVIRMPFFKSTWR